LNASAQPLPKQGTRKPLVIGLLLCVIALAGYLWWRPLQAERELEDASLERLQQITAERPEDARAFYYLGLSLGRKGQKAPAFDALSRASKLAPDNEEIWIALAGTTNGLNGPEASFRVMHNFLKRHPDSAKMKEQRTSLLSSLQRASDGFAGAKRYTEAIQYYRIWLAEEPTATNAQQGLENALKASGSKTEEASNAFLALAEIYEKQGERTKADEARKQAEQIQKSDEGKTKQ
jgi:tetratricopeptide (TPR) repeat protein